MANANVNRIGQINQAGAVDAIFLKVFAGEIITAYEQATLMTDKHSQKVIANGKSAQFPRQGRIGSGYHTPGTEILGRNVDHAEKIISIDALLETDIFLGIVDESMNHYDSRAPLTAEMGRELAKQKDRHVIHEAILGARATNVVTSLPGGTEITSDLFKVGAGGAADVAAQVDAVIESIFVAAETFDNNSVPEDQRYMVVRPQLYYRLVKAVQSNGFSAINTLYGGRGSFADGNIVSIAGITIFKSINLPTTDISGEAFHGVDARKTIALVWRPEGIGTVQLLGLGAENQYDVRRQGTLFVAKYLVGHSWVRNECLIELKLNLLNN